MAPVSTAAILWGALWVCCTSFVPRCNPAGTRLNNAATQVQIPAPLGSSSDGWVARHPGRVTKPDLLLRDTGVYESAPLDTDVNTPLDTDVNTPLDTDVNTPLDTDVNTPLDTDVNTPLDTDIDTPLDTDVDTPMDTDVDTPLDTDVDTPLDTDVDIPLDTDVDTPLDTDVDTPLVPGVNTPLDTDVNTPLATGVNTPLATGVNTPLATGVNTSLDIDVNTPLDTDVNTPLDTSVNTPLDTSVNTPMDTDVDTPMDTDVNTPLDTDVNTPLDTDVDTPLDTDVNSPLDTDVDTPLDTDVNTPLDTDVDTPLDTDVNTPLDTDVDTPLDTDVNTPLDTDVDTPLDTDVNTPLDTDVDTPLDTSANTPLDTGVNTPLDIGVNTPLDTDVDTPLDTNTNSPLDTHVNLSDTNNNPPLDTHVDLPDTSDNPPEGASPAVASPSRGLQTFAGADGMVYAVDAEFLSDCARTTNRTHTNYLNSDSTYHFFKKGTLKIEFRSEEDHTVPATEENKMCYVGVDLRLFDFIWIKLLRFEVSRHDIFRVTFANGFRYRLLNVDDRTFNTSLERDVMFPYFNTKKLRLVVEWRTMPRVFSMEVRYSELDLNVVNFLAMQKRFKENGLLSLDILYYEYFFRDSFWKYQWFMHMETIKKPPSEGVVRTAFWDGSSTFTSDLASTVSVLLSNQFYIDVPNGLRTMVSWEHIGIGVSPDCDTFMVFVVESSWYRGDAILPAHSACRAAPPPPFLLDWPVVRVVVKAPAVLDRYAGFSLRYSFHNASALPQQMDDETWNCSVAHWPDFKRHLLCDLLTDCSGGEDEADCSYTNRGTCRHGDLAAGGSCFTFDPALEALTSWTEAEAACRRRGARLPTLNTPAKWRAVLDLLRHRGWENIYIGLSSGDPSLPDLYSHFLQWSDKSFAYYVKAVYLLDSQCVTCAFLKNNRRPGFVYLDSCHTKVAGNLLCEVEGPRNLSAVAFPTDNKLHVRINSTRCPKGHVTHNFLSCDPRSDCLASCYTSFSSFSTSLPPAFKCRNGFEQVPFTLVCDHREDCSDASDEICVSPPCLEWECRNKQCIPRHKTCDGVEDCLDSSDEIACVTALGSLSILDFSKPLPAMVLHDGKGSYDLLDIDDPSVQSTSSDIRSAVGDCPDSHFQCPGVRYYCLPVYVRCNGVRDCPGHQDEDNCDNFQCTGFYRCRRSKMCLHDDQLCDGIFQCPQRDDELMCGFVCPVGCTCYGLAFYCTVPFDASRHAGIRFLDASESGMGLKGLTNNTMLFYLSLAKCNITQLENMNFVNVFHLDLSKNSITTLTERHIGSCQNLQVFFLAGNPLRRILEESTPGQRASFAELHYLDLSAVSITEAQMVNLRVFSNISTFNLSNTGLDLVSGFSDFRKLRVLDLRGCPVTYFTRSVFQGLDDLSTVYADNYKLCCTQTLPGGFNLLNCHAPSDEVSSCEGLLKSALYRVSLSVLSVLIILGNAGSFVYRVICSRSKTQSSVSMFVTNLCVADFVMGLYSTTIAVADRLFLGNYVWNDIGWRRSVTCKMAGVLSLVSNEVSVLIVCLITVDRFLVTRFPFSRQLHISLRSARVTCVTAWSVGVLLAATPLLPVTSHWQLYSQTGICIPLPVTRVWFVGKQYSFGILIILNFVLFLVIASGQLSIYLSIRANSMATSDTTQKAKDLTIARRLVTVAVSDCLCWFPVGLLGMMSSRGHPIPDEASVVIAVFVLPLNSALNPFLYAVNVILERRQRAREQRLQKIILARHGVTIARREAKRSN